MGKLNVAGVLAKAAAKTEPKSAKSKTPGIELPNHLKAIENWLKASTDEKDAKARKEVAEEALLPVVEKERLTICRRDQKYYSSVKVENGTSPITVSVQNRYSPIDPKDHPTIADIFGDKTDSFFSTKTEISLTDAALNDEKIIEKLIMAVGEDKFNLYFNVKQTVVPTEVFHESRAVNSEIGNKAEVLQAQGILKPYKAAVKQG